MPPATETIQPALEIAPPAMEAPPPATVKEYDEFQKHFCQHVQEHGPWNNCIIVPAGTILPLLSPAASFWYMKGSGNCEGLLLI
jgi:hypothetical protein